MTLTRNAAQATPQEEHVRSEPSGIGAVGNKVGGNNTDDAVPEP